MIEWENGYKSKRYQPVRCDGARLCYVCAMYYCAVAWTADNRDHAPKVYRWRWRARLRGAIGSWAYRRENLKQIHPVG